MAPVTNKRIIFKEFPKGSTFVPGQTIDVDNVSLNGGIPPKTLVLSLEPYVLAKMRPGLPIGYKIRDSIQGYGVGGGGVVRSENPAFPVGDHLHGFYSFEEYSVQVNTEAFSKIDNKYGLPRSVFVGIAGLPGRTAYFGWKEPFSCKERRSSIRNQWSWCSWIVCIIVQEIDIDHVIL